LVFAPHPDDEILGCAGIVSRTLSEGRRVRIVLFTNGDGFPGWASLLSGKPVERLGAGDFVELGRFRQVQSQLGTLTLGVKPEDLVFLGYPDAGLDRVYQARGPEPYRQTFTSMTHTYGPAQGDYHTSAHGAPAPYTYSAALSDLVEILQHSKPGRILVTAEADRHRDHQAAYRFVRDAVRATGFNGAFETYLIHGGPEWPWPAGITPESPFEVHRVKGESVPLGMPWPPPHRLPLRPEEQKLKLSAIRAHATHLAGALKGPDAEERDYLDSFVKSEEVFWTGDSR
jgi:LmbE family N-acetylglucosaminyl deacetylase